MCSILALNPSKSKGFFEITTCLIQTLFFTLPFDAEVMMAEFCLYTREALYVQRLRQEDLSV